MGKIEQEKLKNEALFKKRRWFLLGVTFFSFSLFLIAVTPPLWISAPAMLLDAEIWVYVFFWPAVGLLSLAGFFYKKLGVLLLDLGVYPYQLQVYLYKRLYLNVFKEETVSQVKQRHTSRKLRRHERHKYSRTPKK